jgi:hypothetical protein
MKNPFIEAYSSYFKIIDKVAQKIAFALTEQKPVTSAVLIDIHHLYKMKRSESDFGLNDEFFFSSYHAPVTSDLEFYLARILYHYSKLKHLDWVIHLRSQGKKIAPDIRISLPNDKTIAIVEVKAKGSWIQPFLSKDTYDYDKQNNRYNVDDFVLSQKAQLQKYAESLKENDIENNLFYLIPTYFGVHKKRKYKGRSLVDYQNYFEESSGLSKEQLIVLSENLELNLDSSDTINIDQYRATNYFEAMIIKIESSLLTPTPHLPHTPHSSHEVPLG